LFLGLAFLLTGCTGSAGSLNPTGQKIAAPPRPAYELTARIDPAGAVVEATETVRLPAAEYGSFLIFNVFFNAYSEGKAGGFYFPEFENSIFPDGDSQGRISFSAITVNGSPARWDLSGPVLTVFLPETVRQPLSVKLDFTMEIPLIAHLSGRNDHALWLGSWLPSLAARENGRYLSGPYFPAGDPPAGEVADYRAEISVPQGYLVVSSGEELAAEQRGTQQVYFLAASKVRDLALAVSPVYRKTAGTTARGTVLNLYSYDVDAAVLAQELKRLEDSLEYYEGILGPFPYSELDVVEVDLFLGGMEYPGLIMLDDSYFGDYGKAKYHLAHEAGHQWLYGLIGSDPLKDAWFDEGLTMFLERGLDNRGEELVRAMEREKETLQPLLEAGDNTRLGLHVSAYASWYDYHLVNYRRAAVMHYELYKLLGPENYARFLKALYQEYGFKTITRASFQELAESYYGRNLDSFFAAWF